MGRRWLHDVAVYFGLARETDDQRRQRLESPDVSLAKTLTSSLLAACFVGAVYGVLEGSLRSGLTAAIVVGLVVVAARMLERRQIARDRRAAGVSGPRHGDRPPSRGE